MPELNTLGEVVKTAHDGASGRTAGNAADIAGQADGIVGFLDGLAYEVDVTGIATEDIAVSGLAPSGFVRFEHYGAVGDGVTDDAAAISRALGQGRPIYCPRDKVYACASAITVTDTDVQVYGGTLLFTNATDGLTLTLTGDQYANFDNVTLLTTQQEPGAALTIDRSGYSGTIERNQRLTNITNCLFRGDDYQSAGWTIGLDMDECHAAIVKNNLIVGRRDLTGSGATEFWPGMTYAIRYQSTQDKSPVDSHFLENRINYASSAFYLRGVMEGERFEHNTVVACNKGIDADRTEILGVAESNPYIHIAGNHFNTGTCGVELTRVFFSFIEHNLIYEFTSVDLGFTGISCAIGNAHQIVNNTVRLNVDATVAGVGIQLDQSNHSSIDNNIIATVKSIDKPVVLTDVSGGTSNTRIRGNYAYDGSGDEATLVYYEGSVDESSNPYTGDWGVIASGSNTGGTTNLPADTSTILATISLNDLPVGARLKINATTSVQKSGSAGNTQLFVLKSAGTGDIVFGHDSVDWKVQNEEQNFNSTWQAEINAFAKKTVEGPLSISIRGFSANGDGLIADGGFQYVVERIA